jgi:hypothetical protein
VADVNLKAKITLQDDASKPIASFKQQLVGLAQTSGLAGSAIGTLVGGGLAGLAGLALETAAGTMQAAWALGEMGAQSQRTQASFERLASGVGESGQAMLQAMAAASQGTVANADLMAAANRALVLGVADSAEEMAALTEAAIIRGRDVGVGATQAVNDLVTGIGRMSSEILDNLGIVNASGAFKEYAVELGKTVEQLTEVEKKQALVNAVLASTSGVDLMDDAAANFERMDAALANAQEALGQLFSPAVAAIAQSLADAVNETTDAITTDKLEAAQANLWHYGEEITTLTERIRALRAFIATMKFVDPADAAAATQELNFLTVGLETAGAMYNQFAAITGATAIDMEALAAGVIQFTSAEMQAAPAVETVTQKLIAQAQAARTAIASVQSSQAAGLRSSLLGMAGDLGAGAALGKYKEINAELDARTQRMQTWGYTAEQIEFANVAWIDNTIGALREQVTAIDAVGAAASSAGSAVGSMQSSLQSSIESMVGGQLQGALSLDVAWPGMEGPRQDDVNENARRLAAIANEGLIGQDWLGEFAAEAPATYADLMLKIAEGMDAQGAARLLLGEFQSGLRPDLLDFEMIKQQVKDQLTSQAAIEEMTGELTSQLMAEMGVSAQEVQGAMSQLGLGGGAAGEEGGAADLSASGGQAAGSFSAAFVEGVSVAGFATSLAGKINTDFLKEEGQAALRNSAGAVAVFWGKLFTDQVATDVPGQLLSILTDKLLPLMQAAQAAQASQEGAY